MVKPFCHRQEKLVVFHLAERSQCQCCCLFDYQHRPGKRHRCQRIFDQYLTHWREMVAAEIWIRHPRCLSFELTHFSDGNFICWDAGLFWGYVITSSVEVNFWLLKNYLIISAGTFVIKKLPFKLLFFCFNYCLIGSSLFTFTQTFWRSLPRCGLRQCESQINFSSFSIC